MRGVHREVLQVAVPVRGAIREFVGRNLEYGNLERLEKLIECQEQLTRVRRPAHLAGQSEQVLELHRVIADDVAVADRDDRHGYQAKLLQHSVAASASFSTSRDCQTTPARERNSFVLAQVAHCGRQNARTGWSAMAILRGA